MELPDDIRVTAHDVAFDCGPPSSFDEVAAHIARCLLAERLSATERAAKIVEHRIELANTLAPKAAEAVFVALPDAIRSQP